MKVQDKFENMEVTIISGDRDWVNTVCIIKEVKSNGDCKVTSKFAGDYYNGNVKNIQTDPKGTNTKFEMKSVGNNG